MRKCKQTMQKGSTLTELVVVLSMILLVSYLFLEAFVPGLRLFGKINKRTELMQRGTIVLEKIRNDFSNMLPLTVTLLPYGTDDSNAGGNVSSKVTSNVNSASVIDIKGVSFLQIDQSTPYDVDTNEPKPESRYTVYCFSKERRKFTKMFVSATSNVYVNSSMNTLELGNSCANEDNDIESDLTLKDVISFNITQFPETPGSSPTAFKLILTLNTQESSRNNKGPVELATTVFIPNLDR